MANLSTLMSAMLIKTIAIVVFLVILVSLGTALFHLVKQPDGEQSQKTLKALTLRIGLSVLLFLILFIAYAAGLFQPQGIGSRMQQSHAENPAQQKQ